MLSQIQGLTRETKGLETLQGFDERHLFTFTFIILRLFL